MLSILLHIITVAAIFVVIDAVWLVAVANKFYKQQLGELLKPKPFMPPAVLFYALYVVGIVFFVLEPALERSSVLYAAGAGAFLGLLMYATYDLTNWSTLKRWPARVVWVDLAWGAFVTGLTASLAALLFN